MIPRKIHYCWFGGKELPDLAEKCIASWKKFCPDYEIIRWDESNTDLNENDYIREAYENKKWAFITDYVRLKALYEIGGVYMDTDVEVIASIDSFLTDSAFSGFENNDRIPTGIMAAEKNHPFIKLLLGYYEGKHFVLPNGEFDQQTNVETITNIASQYGFIPNNNKQVVNGMVFYPWDVFCPKDHKTGELNVSPNTVCIHHFNGSWKTTEETKFITVSQAFNRRYGRYGDFLFKIYKYGLHPKVLFKRLMKWK